MNITLLRNVIAAKDAAGFAAMKLVVGYTHLAPEGYMGLLVPDTAKKNFPQFRVTQITEKTRGGISTTSTFELSFSYAAPHKENLSDTETLEADADFVIITTLGKLTRLGYKIEGDPVIGPHSYFQGAEKLYQYVLTVTLTGPNGRQCCPTTGTVPVPNPPPQSFCNGVITCMEPTIGAIQDTISGLILTDQSLAARRVGWICKGAIGGEEYWHNGALQSGTGAVFAIVADRQYHFLQLHGTDGYDENELVDVGFVKSSGTVGSVTVAAYEVDAAGLPTTVLGQTVYPNPGSVKLVAGVPPGTVRTPGTRLRVSIWGNAPFSVRGSSVVPGAQEVSQFNTLNPFVYEFRNQAYGTGVFTPNPSLTVSNTNTAPLIIGKLQ